MIFKKWNVYSKLKSDEELCEKLIHKLPATCQDSCYEYAAEDHEDITQWEIFWDWLKSQESVAKYAGRAHALTDHAMAQDQPRVQKSSQSRLPPTKLCPAGHLNAT